MNKTLLTFALGCVIATATAGTAPAADTEKVARTPEELQAALDPCGDYTTSKIVYPWDRELQIRPYARYYGNKRRVSATVSSPWAGA